MDNPRHNRWKKLMIIRFQFALLLVSLEDNLHLIKYFLDFYELHDVAHLTNHQPLFIYYIEYIVDFIEGPFSLKKNVFIHEHYLVV